MRLCVSLFRGVAAPLGCVICLQLGDVAVFSLCAQYFLNVRGGGGITTLGAFHTVRKPCVARCQNGKLCRFCALIRCAPKERREPSGQRCAYARRCSEGVAAPLGCVIFFASAEIAVCTSCAQGFPHVWGRGGITTLSALCVLLKYRTAACQSGSFAIFRGQVGVVPRTIPIFLRIHRIFCWQFQLQTLLRYGTISSANRNLTLCIYREYS